MAYTHKYPSHGLNQQLSLVTGPIGWVNLHLKNTTSLVANRALEDPGLSDPFVGYVEDRMINAKALVWTVTKKIQFIDSEEKN